MTETGMGCRSETPQTTPRTEPGRGAAGTLRSKGRPGLVPVQELRATVITQRLGRAGEVRSGLCRAQLMNSTLRDHCEASTSAFRRCIAR
jgi:hypothetical protein